MNTTVDTGASEEKKLLEALRKDLDEIDRHQGKAISLVKKARKKISDYEQGKIQPSYLPEERG